MGNDLLTQINASAAREASERAAREAHAARNAAEERLESAGLNPFITLNTVELESLPQTDGGFFARTFGSKEKLGTLIRQVSIKRTDISFLETAKDDFGTVYTIVNLEDRCALYENEDITSVYVTGTIEDTQALINGAK